MNAINESSNSTNDYGPSGRLGAVVLCGGKSSRLGLDKTQLIFREHTFLERVVELVSQTTDRIVLVGPTDFSQHRLSPQIILEKDLQVNCGPLEGIRVGLKRLSNDVEFAFVTSCDVPLLKPQLIQLLLDQIGDHQAIVPFDGKRVYGMTAIYQTVLHQAIEKRIENKQLRVSELASEFDARMLDVDSLREIDPDLDSMTNINSAKDYRDLLKRFGLEISPEIANRIK